MKESFFVKNDEISLLTDWNHYVTIPNVFSSK